jgi:hypothetical protein
MITNTAFERPRNDTRPYPDDHGDLSPHRMRDVDGPYEPTKSQIVADRLIGTGDANAMRIGHQIQRCAFEVGVRRCGHALCPRCQARVAKKRRWRLSGRAREWSVQGLTMGMLTLTTSSATIGEGRARLMREFARLRLRKCWAPVACGLAQIEWEPTMKGSAWNVHLHALMGVRGALDARALRDAWCELMADEPASTHWAPIGRRSARTRDTFLARRALRDEALPRRLARVHRRAARPGCARGSLQAVGRAVWPTWCGGFHPPFESGTRHTDFSNRRENPDE